MTIISPVNNRDAQVHRVTLFIWSLAASALFFIIGKSTRIGLQGFGLDPIAAAVAYMFLAGCIFLLFIGISRLSATTPVQKFLKKAANYPKSLAFRLWVAACLSWLLVVLVYAFFFYRYGSTMSTRELIYLIKLFAGPSAVSFMVFLFFGIALGGHRTNR